MKIAFTGGKTGGHIYPALSFIKGLESKHEIFYIGNKDSFEEEIMKKNNVRFYGIEVVGIERKLTFKNVKNCMILFNAVKKAKQILKEEKPDYVIGVGGFVSYPALKAAKDLKIKIILHEQNQVPGLVNKIFSKSAMCTLTSFPKTYKHIKGKCLYSGNPRTYEFYTNSINKHRFNHKMLVVFGSMGSSSLINFFIKNCHLLENKGFDVYIVLGKNFKEKMTINEEYHNIHFLEYIDNMKEFLLDIDLVVSRSGATTLSEIIGYRIPAILIPSPYVTNDHQTKNAIVLKNLGSALVYEEKILNSEIFNDIIRLMKFGNEYFKMCQSYEKYEYVNSIQVLENFLGDKDGEANI